LTLTPSPDSNGEIIATSAPFKYRSQSILRSIEPERSTAVISYDSGGASGLVLHILGERLEQTEAPMRFGFFNMQEGFGYRRPDQSLVLFGSASTQSGDRGAVEWVAQNGETLASAVVPQVLESMTFGDAVALPDNQFVVCRIPESVCKPYPRPLLSWITLS
jgi:hypothetical protein